MPRAQPPQGNTSAVTNTPSSNHQDQNSDMQDSSHYPAHEDHHHHHGYKESGVNNNVRSTMKRRSSNSSSKGPVVLLIDKPLRKLMAEEFSLKRQSSHGKLYLDLDDKLAATYDYDTNEDAEDDDASDAGSEFTEDYSRHNQRCTMLPSYDAEEESSLSSIGSFGEEQEESWSDYGGEGGSQSSSTVDSRQQLRKMKTHQLHNDYRVDGIHGTLSTQFDGHLLEDSTEFSVEEDPLFNASGTIRMYNPPPPVPVVATSSAAEVWTDEEDFHDTWVPPPPNDQIWRETTDGQWIPNSNNDHAGVQSPQLDRWSSTSSVGPDQIPSSPHAANRRFQRQPSARSILTTTSSFESFAGDGTPPSQRRKRQTSRRASRQSSTASSPNTNNSRKGDGRPPPPPPPPLRQDSKMHIDDSDDDDIIKEVLIFSDEEDDITSNSFEDSKPFAIPATILENSLATMPGTSEHEAVGTATAAATTAITITLMASADSSLKERSRSKSPNPIVPSPRLAKRKTVNVDLVVVANSAKMELPTHQKRQGNNTSPVKGFRSTENVRCFISPNDCVGPLKDHSKRTRPKKSKSSSSSRSLCGKSNKKKKKKSKSRSSKNTTTVSVMGEEDYQTDTESTVITEDSIHYDPTISLQAARDMAAAHPFDSDDNCSVASNCSASSDCSNDTMDATGVTRSKRRKSSSKSSKDKKAAKKKRKKERPRKRGRRADYEEDSTEDDDPAQESSKPGAVADRVEAIFTNKQMIFESNLHQRATTVEKKKEHSKVVAAAAAVAAAAEEEEPTSHAIAEQEATTETVAEMMEPEATKASPTLSLTAKNTILDAVEGGLETLLSSISNFNAADISFRHGEDTDDKPTTFRLKSKAAEECEASKSSSKRGGRSLRRSKSSIDPPDSSSRGKSKTRSRSVSKESASRSHRRSRSKSKDAGRSSKSEKSNNKERNQSKSPSRSKSRKSVRRSKSSNVTNTKKDEEDKSSVKEKKKTLKSPTSPKQTKGNVTMTPISSNNAMTLQDVIGRGAETSEDDNSIDPRLASPTSLHQKSLLVASQQSLDLSGSMMLSLASVSTNDDINGNEIPVGNINLVRIRIKRMQGKIEEIQLQTKDELKHLQQEFDRKKSFLEGKVRAEEKTSNAMEAIMYLHKITVKDLHQQGRKMKKTMKHFQKGISYEIAKSVELIRQSQELQRQTTAKVMEIRQLERENAHHSRNLQRCQTEHQELIFDCRADFHTHSGILVGSVEDYATETLIPLYQKWRLPKSIEKTKIEVLAKSYILPKSSIFYNV